MSACIVVALWIAYPAVIPAPPKVVLVGMTMTQVERVLGEDAGFTMVFGPFDYGYWCCEYPRAHLSVSYENWRVALVTPFPRPKDLWANQADGPMRGSRDP